jgi:hypothetical protein
MKKNPPSSPSGSVRKNPIAGFLPSLFFVLGSMLLTGLAQVFYEDILVPQGLLEASNLKMVAGAWALLIGASAVLYFRQLYRILSTVRTSVVILALFTLSCVAGSFLLQQRDLDSRGMKGEKAYKAFREAEAGFLYYLAYGQKYRHPISENGQKYFDLTRERYGDEYAAKRTEMFHKMMGMRNRDAEVTEFAESYDSAFRLLWNFSRATRLQSIHRSWPFVTLMLLLSLSLMAGTHKRFVWRATQVGFYMTHLGFLVLMFGFALSMVGEQRGILPLTIGKTLNQVWEFKANKAIDLGFQVTLEDFYTEHNNEIFSRFLDIAPEAEGFPGPVQRQLKAYPGTTYEIWGGKYQVKVLDAAEYGTAYPEVVEVPDGPSNPAVQIDLTGSEGSGANGWLFALSGAQSSYQDPRERFVLSFFAKESPALVPPAPGEWGTLILRSEGFPEQKEAVIPGKSFNYAGKTLKIKKVAPDFANRTAPTEMQSAQNPALELEITGENGKPIPRWTFAWIDFDSLHTPVFPEIKMSYLFRSGKVNANKVLRLLETKKGLELITFNDSGTPRRRAILPGQEIPTGVEDFRLKLNTYYRSAKQEYKVDPSFERDLLAHDREHPSTDQDHTDHASPLGPVAPDIRRKFHPPGPPAVKLQIIHPGGTVERWFLSGHPQAGAWSDGILQLRFAPTGMVKEWRSLLVASDGVTTRRQLVRVNTTMDFHGWTMYQTDADAKRPDYSGIQVLKDPGWYLIEPGLMFVCLGVIFMFWIKPWLKMDQSGGSQSQAGKVHH